MAKPLTVNQVHGGSIPLTPVIHCRMDDWQVALTLNQGEVGSTPTQPSKF